MDSRATDALAEGRKLLAAAGPELADLLVESLDESVDPDAAELWKPRLRGESVKSTPVRFSG